VKIFLILFLGLLSGGWSGEMGQPVRVGKKFGYGDGAGGFLVEPRWDWAWPLTEGRAGVREGRNWYLVDEVFRRVGAKRYDWVGPF
jgi:hypothetical protein